MQLVAHQNPALPKFAWVAAIDRPHGVVTLNHGPLVEVRPSFWIEGVWNGPFQHGDFGTTECVFGTGGIVAEDSVRLVTSAATVDYLYYAVTSEHVTVSNSLPLLLASIGDALDPQCSDYPRICRSVRDGIMDYQRTLPTVQGQVQRVMYWNLDVSREEVLETDKNMPPQFSCFDDYRNYLRDNYARIAANARDRARTQRLDICSTQSQGYDSTAINVLCRPYGIDKVFTVSQAKSVSHFAHQDASVAHADDDGGEICALLGLPCTRLDRRAFAKDFADESLYYCTQHYSEDANLNDLQRHLKNPSLLLTGLNGDGAWEAGQLLRKTVDNSVLRRASLGMHSMGEFRLAVGFIHLPLPFMGGRRKAEIVAITESEEMRPWRLNTTYDRPIPRRIAEEAGIPRHLFGQSKKASVVIFSQPSIPHGETLRSEFFAYLRDHGLLPRWRAWLWPAVRWVNSTLSLKYRRWFGAVYYAERLIARLLRQEFKFPRLWSRLDGSLFCFCVNRQARQYAQVLRKHHLPISRKDSSPSSNASS